MKNLKTKSIELKWLPPAEEWDFRSVTPTECRVACHWKYERENHPFAATQKYFPPNYRQAAQELFPQPWPSLMEEQRQKVLATFLPSPTLQVRSLREFFKRMPLNGAHPEILQGMLHHSYVVVPNFRVHGVEAVIKEFEKWARKEAKQYPASRRAQAAELPFDTLKWLAAARVDKARRKANVTIELARETVLAYRQANRQVDEYSVLPIYASDGAWSKAKSDSQLCREKVRNNPSLLLAELA